MLIGTTKTGHGYPGGAGSNHMGPMGPDIIPNTTVYSDSDKGYAYIHTYIHK